MLNTTQSSDMKAAFTALQDRIAYGLRSDLRNHDVLVSVSISDRKGNVLQTIQPDSKSSNWSVGFVSNNGKFADGIVLDTHDERVAAMFEVAAHVWSLAVARASNKDQVVISATFQDSSSGTTMNYVAQAFIAKDKTLTIKHVVVQDNS